MDLQKLKYQMHNGVFLWSLYIYIYIICAMYKLEVMKCLYDGIIMSLINFIIPAGM
jgi:hypothetical protein